MKKLAFLFLIYDDIWNEELWYLFFLGIDPQKYVIHIHFKKQKELLYFEDRKLKVCVPTKYGDISLCYAHNLLFKEALQDPDVYKMINVSQACCPFKSFDYIYDKLCMDENSYFNVNRDCKTCVNKHYKSVLKFLDESELWKSSEWFILNRHHALVVTNNDTFLSYFKEAFAPEEYYFISIIMKLSPDLCSITDNLADGATTFTNWKGMNYKFPMLKECVKNYSDISSLELEHLLNSPCLFGRKFKKGCTVDGKKNLKLDDVIMSRLS